MSNELAMMNKGIIDLNRTISYISNFMTRNERDRLKQINIDNKNNNTKNTSKNINDIVSNVGNKINATVTNLGTRIENMKPNSITTISKTEKVVNNNNTISNNNKQIETILKETNKTKVETVTKKATDNKLLSKLSDYLDSGLGFFKNEKQDNQKNVKKDFFGKKALNSTLTYKNKIADTLKDIQKPTANILDGLALLGIGGYALYETLKGKVNKWTGTIKLFGKSLIKYAGGLLKPITSFIKELLPSTLKVGKKGISKVVGKTAYKSLAKNMTKLLGKTALKKIPVIGALFGLGLGIKRFNEGDMIGGLMEIASGISSIVPIAGTAISLGIDLLIAKRDFDRGDNFKQQPIGSQLQSGLKNMKDNISWKNIPVIGNLMYTYDGIVALSRGDYKGAMGNFAKSILPTPIYSVIDFLSGVESSNEIYNKKVSLGKDSINQVIQNNASRTAKNVNTAMTKYETDIVNSVTSSVAKNETYLNKNNIDKLNKKEENDKKMDELINISKSQLQETQKITKINEENKYTRLINNNRNNIKG